MNILAIILIILAIVIAIFLLVALFVKKEYAIVRKTTINKPKQEVFNYLKLMKNQSAYNKWWRADPGAMKDYKGTDGTVGFTVAWDSADKKVGKGEQEVKKITEGERIEYELRFIKPFEGKADAHMTTNAVAEDQTNVTWGFSSSMKYPMNIMLLFINMEEMLGKDLEASLTDLKGTLEKA